MLASTFLPESSLQPLLITSHYMLEIKRDHQHGVALQDP